MSGEKNLTKLIKGMSLKLNSGNYVFCIVNSLKNIKRKDTICEFKKVEEALLILKKEKVDNLNLKYEYIAS